MLKQEVMVLKFTKVLLSLTFLFNSSEEKLTKIYESGGKQKDDNYSNLIGKNLILATYVF